MICCSIRSRSASRHRTSPAKVRQGCSIPFSMGQGCPATGGLEPTQERIVQPPAAKGRVDTRDDPCRSCYPGPKACPFQPGATRSVAMQHVLPASLRMPPSATGAVTRLAAGRVAAAGLNPDPLLRQAGLAGTAIQDPDARVEVAAQVAFLNLVAEALPDPLLGFHLAQGFDPREVGLLYFVLASSATLGDALARVARYSTIANEGIELRTREGTDL